MAVGDRPRLGTAGGHAAGGGSRKVLRLSRREGMGPRKSELPGSMHEFGKTCLQIRIGVNFPWDFSHKIQPNFVIVEKFWRCKHNSHRDSRRTFSGREGRAVVRGIVNCFGIGLHCGPIVFGQRLTQAFAAIALLIVLRTLHSVPWL